MATLRLATSPSEVPRARATLLLLLLVSDASHLVARIVVGVLKKKKAVLLSLGQKTGFAVLGTCRGSTSRH